VQSENFFLEKKMVGKSFRTLRTHKKLVTKIKVEYQESLGSYFDRSFLGKAMGHFYLYKIEISTGCSLSDQHILSPINSKYND
jgi:hypothetical protein